MPWQTLQPNVHGDWLNQRNDLFETFIPIEPNKKFDGKSKAYFYTYGIGINTNRDAWTYNFSESILNKKVQESINFYNHQRELFASKKSFNPSLVVEDFIDTDPQKISWTRSLRNNIYNDIPLFFDIYGIVVSSYRPFCKQKLYFNRALNEAIGLNPVFFPGKTAYNIVICVSPSSSDGLSLLITNCIANLHFNGDTQSFPLYYYEERQKSSPTLFDAGSENEFIRRDGVSDFILERAQKMYGIRVTKEDIFYYVYGILHSPEYRLRFSNNLKKMLPRIPLVDEPREFWSFSKGGRELAELHINYESLAPYDGVTFTGAEKGLFNVDKMRFPKKGQKETILYNGYITISNIPDKAYEYVVNGKSAIEWIMERYQITTHKESGITNDPNDWAKEVGNPRYILDLLLSVIALSLKTVTIVESLPELKFE